MAQPPERYEAEKIAEAISFLQLLNDRFGANSAIRKEFFSLLADFSNDRTTDGAAAAVARANTLLQGHPDLAERFHAFLDPEMQALQFLERVKNTDIRIYDHVVAAVRRVGEEPGLNAHDVYAEFGEVFGPGNEDLLRGFARFLPTEYDPPPSADTEGEEEDLCSTPKRKHDAHPGVGAAEHGSRSSAKKPGTGMDDVPTPTHDPAASDAGADAACRSRPSRAKKSLVYDDAAPKPDPLSYDGVGVVGGSRPSRAKKSRSYDDPEPKPDPISYDGVGVVGGSRPSRAKKPRVHDDPEQKPNPISYTGTGVVGGSRPSRAKKPRADNGAKQCSPLDGVVRGAAAQYDDNSEVLRFRRLWEFETWYSKLVATMARAEELQRQGARGAALEELFPSRECREFLADMYYETWGSTRRMLEDNEFIGRALEGVLKRLTAMEAAAVEAARSWRDPARAKQRLKDLLQDRVREERERRRARGI